MSCSNYTTNHATDKMVEKLQANLLKLQALANVADVNNVTDAQALESHNKILRRAILLLTDLENMLGNMAKMEIREKIYKSRYIDIL